MEYEALLDLVKKRRSIRRFKPDPIPDEDIAKIIEVARWAPSGFNMQPWEFVVVGPQARARLLAMFRAKADELLADPDLPAKMRAGHPERVVRCGGCLQGCLLGVKAGKGIGTFCREDSWIRHAIQVGPGDKEKPGPLFEQAGPREKIFFEPRKTTAAQSAGVAPLIGSAKGSATRQAMLLPQTTAAAAPDPGPGGRSGMPSGSWSWGMPSSVWPRRTR